MISNFHQQRVDPFSKQLWRWEGPQRIRSFLWHILRGGLKTNVRRLRCHLADFDTCPLCEAYLETEIHILHDCKWVTEVWKRVQHTPIHNFSWYANLEQWIRGNVIPQTRGIHQGWHILFGITIWLI